MIFRRTFYLQKKNRDDFSKNLAETAIKRFGFNWKNQLKFLLFLLYLFTIGFYHFYFSSILLVFLWRFHIVSANFCIGVYNCLWKFVWKPEIVPKRSQFCNAVSQELLHWSLWQKLYRTNMVQFFIQKAQLRFQAFKTRKDVDFFLIFSLKWRFAENCVPNRRRNVLGSAMYFSSKNLNPKVY